MSSQNRNTRDSAGNAYANCSRCFSIVDGCATGMDYQPRLWCLLSNLSGWLLPAAIAYGWLIVDTVVLASRWFVDASPLGFGTRGSCDRWLVRQPAGLSICQSLLRVLLGQRVNMLILEKALTLDLAHFEDSEF